MTTLQFTEEELEFIMMAVKYYGMEARQEGDTDAAKEADALWRKLSKS